MSLADHILGGVMKLLSLLPIGVARAAGRLAGRMFYRLDRKHRTIVQENLAASFPDKDPLWVRRTAIASFEHICQVAMELPRLYCGDLEWVIANTRMHGLDIVDQAMARGKGVIVITGHLGNWEWACVATGIHLELPTTVVARPLDWPPADRMINAMRTRTGNLVVPKAGSARAILRTLRQKRMAALLLDQNVDWYDGQWVDFFGRPACTNKGAALLALKSKATVITYHSFRAPDGKLDVCFGPEIPLADSGDKTQDVWDNTRNYTKALEDIIRERPEQWFWLHQRWKTKPSQPWPRGGK